MSNQPHLEFDHATDFGPPAPAAAPISPDAFAYLDSLAHATVTVMIGNLVDAGDVANLKNALAGGCAAVQAAERMERILRLVRNTRVDRGNPAAVEILDVANKWAAGFEAADGAAAVHKLARKVISDAVSPDALQIMLQVLSCAPSGLDFHAVDENRQVQGRDRDRDDNIYDEMSLIGLLVQRGFVDLAIHYAGGDSGLSEFPVTRIFKTLDRGRETMNLAEHIAMSSQMGLAQLQHLTAAIAPTAEEPWYQLGDMVLRILQRDTTNTPLNCDTITDCSYDMRRYLEQNQKDEEDLLMPVYALIGAGASFRHPTEAWIRIREARLTGPDPQSGNVRPDMPLAHALLYADADVYPRSLCAVALRRMIEEGGLSPEREADMGNNRRLRLLQLAALIGHSESAEVLLACGADPLAPGAGDDASSAMQIAQAFGQEEIHHMFLAHQARKTIDNVLSMRPPAPPGK